MASTNIFGIPEVTSEQLEKNEAHTLNRALQLLANKINSVEVLAPAPARGQTGPSVNGGPALTVAASTSTTVTEAATVALAGTHADRLASHLPGDSVAGTFFYETDRLVTYIDLDTGGTQVWQWEGGTMRGAYAVRPTDLSGTDSGFLFYATDLNVTFRWDGAAWSVLFAPILQDTHGARLSGYLSTFFPTGTLFYESDRTSWYIDQNSSGTLNGLGTFFVTWISGDKFDFATAAWVGKTIVIGGTNYQVASVVSPTSLAVTSIVAIAAGLTWSIASGKWEYSTGEYSVQQASLPADLVTSDNGFIAGVSNFVHRLRWDGPNATWNWAPGDGGSGYVQAFAVDPSPSTGWKLCNGTATTYLKSDGTTAALTPPDLLGSPAFLQFGSPYTGTVNAAVAPTIAGQPISTGLSSTGDTVTTTDTGLIFKAGVDGGALASAVLTPGPGGHDHTLPTLTVDADGFPPNVVMRPWFRR